MRNDKAQAGVLTFLKCFSALSSCKATCIQDGCSVCAHDDIQLTLSFESQGKGEKFYLSKAIESIRKSLENSIDSITVRLI